MLRTPAPLKGALGFIGHAPNDGYLALLLDIHWEGRFVRCDHYYCSLCVCDRRLMGPIYDAEKLWSLYRGRIRHDNWLRVAFSDRRKIKA